MTQGLDGQGSPGSWLRKCREAAGLTQEELAERAGLSTRTISSLEHDRIRKPYPRSVRRMIAALGLPEAVGVDLIAWFRGGPDAGSDWTPQAHVDRPSMLSGPEIEPTSPVPCQVPRQLPIPRQLPLTSRHFVGRRAELGVLTRLLDQAARLPGALVIAAIAGTAGVGKTALAVHWAHQIADRFPDGQLYVNLRGFDLSGTLLAAADALAGFLRALGVPSSQIPVDVEDRAAHYRTLLAGRRMLIVLDNAASVEQVRPLLPGTAGCLALVTSRNALAGLVAGDGAERLDLDTLPLDDAVDLLRTLVGKRVDADLDAAASLAAHCARLPLALCVAAELAAARPSVSLAGLADELTDVRRRLDLLDADGDPRAAVRAAFSWSYQYLDPDAARGFRLVGLQPGLDLDRHAVAALTGMTAPQADDLLNTPAAVPRQLPVPPRLFTGRQRELRRLSELAAAGATLVITAIGGAGGIGKTWLALHWAAQHLDRFPDGQLYVDLRGFDPTGQPTPPGTALHRFLEALGVHPADIPAGLDERTTLFRSLAAGRRMLVVADNARDADQVIPLLPGSPTCTVLITSRYRLTGLAATHGGHLLDLDVLPEAEARDVLARHVPAASLAAEPQAVADLLAVCAGLPLALGITAVRAAQHPGFPLAALARELRDASARLDALDAGDPHSNVRAVLSWSHRVLDEQAATVFGLLGLAPGPDIGLPAAAALTGLPAGQARTVLRELENASLLQQDLPGRYRMHDLTRLYAAGEAGRRLPAEVRAVALRRVVEYYLHTAYAAERLLNPHRDPIRIDPPLGGGTPESPADPAAALHWFDVEHPCVLAAQQHAVASDWPAMVWQFAWVLSTFHARRGHHDDDLACWRSGLAAADELADPAVQRLVRERLGRACARSGRYAEAVDLLTQTLALAEQAGDLAGQATTHGGLTLVWELDHNHRRALTHAIRALRLQRTIGNPAAEATELAVIGWHLACLGRYDTARNTCERAIAHARQLHSDNTEAAALDTLGYIAHHTGQHTTALDHYNQALTAFRTAGSTHMQADILDQLGDTHVHLGQHEEARLAWQRALELYQQQHRPTHAERLHLKLTTSHP